MKKGAAVFEMARRSCLSRWESLKKPPTSHEDSLVMVDASVAVGKPKETTNES